MKELREKLSKAKAFIKHQDQLFKDVHAASFHEESEESYRSQISTLEIELDRQRVSSTRITLRVSLLTGCD